MKKFMASFALTFLACSSSAAAEPPAEQCTPSMSENAQVKRLFAYENRGAVCEMYSVRPEDVAPSVLCIATVCRMNCHDDWMLSRTVQPMCADIDPFKGTL